MNKIEFPLLGIDYGKKHIGVAISDTKGIVAQPLCVINSDYTTSSGQKNICETVQNIIATREIKGIVVGVPQKFTEKQEITVNNTITFIEWLKNIVNIPVYTIDESFSTVAAQNMLLSMGQHQKKNRKRIDSLASAVFLQNFLNSITRTK